MPDIAIDTDAVQSARITMLTVRDTLNGLYSQYEHTAGQMEGSLWDAASEVLDSLNPLHLLEAFDIWDRWGFGGVAYSCSSTRGALEDARGVTDQVVERLCEAHPGPVAQALHDRANDLRSALGAALDSLWTITSLLNPDDIRRLIENPGTILDHSASVRGSLRRACDAAQSFVDFLTRLHANEQALIDEITHSLAVTSPSLAGSLQGGPITIQGSSGYLQGEQSPAQASISWGQRAADIAIQLETFLTKNVKGSYNGFNTEAFLNKFPPGKERDRMRDLVNALFARGGSDWNNSDGTFNVQCVAFVALTYAIATGDPAFLPAKGNAGDLWDAYAKYPEKGWHEIGNKAGASGWPPQVGDMVPMTWNVWGHVAVVSNVHYDANHNVDWIEIAQGNTQSPIERLNVTNGVVDSPSDCHIQGFIRYTGS